MVPEIMVENVWKHSTISGGRNVEPGLLLSPSLSRRLRESSVQAIRAGSIEVLSFHAKVAKELRTKGSGEQLWRVRLRID